MYALAIYSILVISSVCTLIGLLLLRIAIKGKLISPNPHCRKCRFDLAGLDLTDPAPCPECGTRLALGTRSITQGLRKTRKLVLLAAVLFLLTAASAIAWPKLSKLPSIQSINIYNHFPEALLVKLATTGDHEALQTLHDRLIPGAVSDKAFDRLIEHAFVHKADTTTPWDERWGDVLIYAFLSDKMTQEQAIDYIEGAFEFRVYIHPVIDRELENVAVHIEHRTPDRGASGVNFRYNWSRATKQGQFLGDIDTPYKFTISKEIPREPGPNPRAGGSGGSGSLDPERPGWWIPYTPSSGSIGSSVRVPNTLDSFDCTFVSKVKVYKDDELFHSWESRIVTQTIRVDEPDYAAIVTDPEIIDDLAAALTCTPIRIPTRAREAKEHSDITDSVSSQFSIRTSINSPHGMLGELWIRSGEEELKFTNMMMTIKERHGHGFTGPYSFGRKNETWLDFYIDHEEFWEGALEKGSVDVIYRPSPSMAANDPRLESMIGSQIIFRDVPLVKLVPKLKPIGQGRNGPVVDTWTMSPINEMEVGRSYTPAQMAQFRGPDGVVGELLEE